MNALKLAIAAVLVLAFVSPVFASANITAFHNKAPAYANTRANVSIINITINASGSTVVLSGVNVTLTGTVLPGNISVVRIFANDTSGPLLGSNSTWTNTSTLNYTFINFAPNYSLSNETTIVLLVVYETYSAAQPRSTFGANITVADFNVNDTVSNDTITPINSSLVQIQDVHATAVVTPRIVDTNVANQNFYFNITPTGRDPINWTRIILPAGYSISSLVSIFHDNTLVLTGVNNQTGVSDINVSFATPTTYPIIVNFTVNTNTSAKTSQAFQVNISGSNLTYVVPDITDNQTNVTTKTLINYTVVNAIKGSAYINGTDYWEFNFTLGFNFTSSEYQSGMIQFKMTNWTDSAGRSINLTNGTGTYFASLREGADFNNTNMFNITHNYNTTAGITKTSLTAGFVYLTLRMVIPLDTVSSSSWWSTYSMIFRATP